MVAASIHLMQSAAISTARSRAIKNRTEVFIHRSNDLDQGAQQLRQRYPLAEGVGPKRPQAI